MLIHRTKRKLKIYKRHNEYVYEQLQQLNSLLAHSHDRQEMLDGLARMPSGSLQFNNQWIYTVGYINIALFFSLFIIPIGHFLVIFIIIALALISYICYENQQPVIHCIQNLEKKMIQHQYQLQYSLLPMSFSGHYRSSSLALAFFKQRFFPLFEQGTVSNTFTDFASTSWTDCHGRTYPVVIFQYEYINDVPASHLQQASQPMIHLSWMDFVQNRGRHRVHQRKPQQLWGIFVFNVDLNGFAVSTEHDRFPTEYYSRWQSSDIQVNQKFSIRGESERHLAQTMTPHRILLLNQIFAQRKGYLHCHSDMSMMCFLGKRPILQIPNHQYEHIANVAHLRGHLRRLKLAEYESLQHDLLAFLENSLDVID